VAYRIGAISDDLCSEFDGAARVATRCGLDGLGVRHVGGTSIRDVDRDCVRRIKRCADSYGLVISAVSSPFGRDLYLGAEDAPAVAILDRMISYAEVLDTPLVRVFAPWIAGKDPLPEWSGRPNLDTVLGEVAERMSRYARRAERAGVTLMVELEGASYVGSVAEAERVLAAVGSPALVLCWDVCNAWWSGEDVWETSWPIARSLPVVDVQTKDVRVDPDDSQSAFRQVVLGEGDLPYDRLLPALLTDGYEGWFTVERVYHPRKPEQEPGLLADILADVAALKALIGR